MLDRQRHGATLRRAAVGHRAGAGDSCACHDRRGARKPATVPSASLKTRSRVRHTGKRRFADPIGAFVPKSCWSPTYPDGPLVPQNLSGRRSSGMRSTAATVAMRPIEIMVCPACAARPFFAKVSARRNSSRLSARTAFPSRPLTWLYLIAWDSEHRMESIHPGLLALSDGSHENLLSTLPPGV